MSVQNRQTFGQTSSMFEGYGGPVNVDKTDLSGIDPTLDACCQREIESNRKQNSVEAALRRHDRIRLAERRRLNVAKNLSWGDGCRCCYDPNSDGGEYTALVELRATLKHNNDEQNEEQNEQNLGLEHLYDIDNKDRYSEKDSDNDSDSDDEFDYLLDEDLPDNEDEDGYGNESKNVLKLLQQERIEELQLAAMIHESAIQHGFGVHRQLHPQRVLHAAGLGMGGVRGPRAASIPPTAVIHLNEDSQLSATLDICLEELAQSTYKGTKFLRSNGRSTLLFNGELANEVLPRLKPDSSLPALIAVKDGAVIAVCENLRALGSTKDEKVEPEAVEEWLDRAGVLLREVPIAFEDYCRIRPEEDALVANMMREKARLAEISEVEIHQCGVPGCRKTFSHQHIGIKNEEQSGLILCQELVEGI